MAKKKVPRKPASKNGVQIVRANASREEVVDPAFVSLYANDTQVQTSPWDFRLIFGQISTAPTRERKTIVINQVGEVRMSPQHVKTLVQVLLQQLAGYEARFGRIPQPKD